MRALSLSPDLNSGFAACCVALGSVPRFFFFFLIIDNDIYLIELLEVEIVKTWQCT